jgi:archaeosine-15-forming tRNA-guanine transglycosylase
LAQHPEILNGIGGTTMKPKIRVILEQAIEDGVRRGYSRAHKHVENPTENAIIEQIEDAVMSAIYEYFTFDEEDF